MAGHAFTFAVYERDHFVARGTGQNLSDASYGCDVFNCPAAYPCPAKLLASANVKV